MARAAEPVSAPSSAAAFAPHWLAGIESNFPTRTLLMARGKALRKHRRSSRSERPARGHGPFRLPYAGSRESKAISSHEPNFWRGRMLTGSTGEVRAANDRRDVKVFAQLSSESWARAAQPLSAPSGAAAFAPHWLAGIESNFSTRTLLMARGKALRKHRRSSRSERPTRRKSLLVLPFL